MSHDDQTSAKLIRMANQIGKFFDAQSGSDRAARVAEHINKFWEPRMRRQFLHLFDMGAAVGGKLPAAQGGFGHEGPPQKKEGLMLLTLDRHRWWIIFPNLLPEIRQ